MIEFNQIITELEKSLHEKLASRYFDSKQNAQEEFDTIWACAIHRIKSVIPADKYYVAEAIQNPPSIIKFVFISGRWNKWLYKLKRTLFKTQKVKSEDIIDIRQISLMSRQILDVASIIANEGKNEDRGGRPCTETIPIQKFKKVLEIIQRGIGDMYANTDINNVRRTKGNMIQTLYGEGYDVIEYDETNDALFDVRTVPNCCENIIISPTIRNCITGQVELMGIVYKPCKN